VEDFLLGGVIAAIFLAPALLRPTLGRVVVSALFLGGGVFNLLYTLPHLPGSLIALVATAPIPPYREVVSAARAWNATPALVLAVVTFELATGVLILGRGPVVRLALVAAAAWTLGMLPLIPPYGMPIGIALAIAPGLAGLVLARGRYPQSVWAPWKQAGASWLHLLVHPMTGVLGLASAGVLFVLVLHPWLMNWGSTSEEQIMVLPGDSAPPDTYFTRAITIDAPPSTVWPWLLAIGQDRAGFLSYDYLENLTGADIHNADVLRPEWQQRALGDRVPMASPGLRAIGGDATLTTIWIVEAERVIADTPGRFVVVPLGDSATRLLLRESLDDPIRGGAAWVLWDPMHFVMEQRMLQGIKERSEGRPLVPPAMQAIAHVGWALASLGLLERFLSRRAWRPWLVLPIGLVVPALLFTGDVNSAMAGFLAGGITAIGFLTFGRRWLAPYLLIATGVALVLLLAPDTYVAFGLVFLLIVAVLARDARDRLHRLSRAWPSEQHSAVAAAR
jgi:hypothetical protein